MYLIWKCTSNRRQYIVGQLTKNGQYEFQYGGEIKDAIKVGFKPLVSFEKLGNVYKCEELFPVFQADFRTKKEKILKKSWKSINWKNMIRMSY